MKVEWGMRVRWMWRSPGEEESGCWVVVEGRGGVSGEGEREREREGRETCRFVAFAGEDNLLPW